MSFLKPCIKAVGPPNAKLAFVGEAPGEQEELLGEPFVGRSGQEARALCGEVGLDWDSSYRTNVLWTRPPGNKFDLFLVPRKELPPDDRTTKHYKLPAVDKGKFLHPSLAPELDRLYSELQKLRPNLVVALGAKASWALLGLPGIGGCRGVVSYSPHIRQQKVLPTYHPANLFRNWSNRVIVLQDLLKAKREMEFAEIKRVERKLLVDPDWTQVKEFVERAFRAPILSCDIETERKQITSIGFAISPSEGLVIPFWDKRKPGWSFWSELNESLILDYIDRLLRTHPCVLFQNGLYDVQYIFREWGIPVPGFTEDLMLKHHSMYPELPKGLGFLGSIYTNEVSWKKMRQWHGAEETKREE